jgi:plasmid stabilization system protein ParE
MYLARDRSRSASDAAAAGSTRGDPGRSWPTPRHRWAPREAIGFSGVSPYVVFYRPIEDTIEVLRILHGARDIVTIFESES